jgi:hypothetical protein
MYIHIHTHIHIYIHAYILLRSKIDLLTIDIGIHSLKIGILSEAVTVEPATLAVAADSAVMAVTSVPVPLPKIERLLETPGNAGYIHTHTHTHTHKRHVLRLPGALFMYCVCMRARGCA